MSNLNEEQVNAQIHKIKQYINSSPQEERNLNYKLGSAVKHLPIYAKIIKTHIEQLKQVLRLDSHSNRKLEDIELAKPVHQLMEIFDYLQDDDYQLLEYLFDSTQRWRNETAVAAETSTISEA